MPDSPTPDAKPAPEDQLVVTRHSLTLGDQELHYTVTTGTIVLKEETEKTGDKAGEHEGEKPRATLFFIAYTLDGMSDPATRPVTFSFNGGPGSSSVWLHMGALGPRRVVMDDIGNLPPPPYQLTDNEHTLLDVSDLVFIDPVGTGYSRPVVGDKAGEFHAFKKDIESVGDFIRLWTTRYERWLSPKYLIGESYGTTRAAGLSGYLQERHGMYLNGIMLVSVVLDFGTLLFLPTNDLPAILYLPSYAATAWYHKKLAPELQALSLAELLREVETFAAGAYAAALFKGAGLSAAERGLLADRVARYTGLSAEYVDRSDLRIDIMRFCRELLRDQRRTVGRLDSRFTGIERDAVGDSLQNDPSFTNIIGPYTAAFNDYVRRELGFEIDMSYEILSIKTNETWRFEHDNRFVEVAETLRRAMTLNPHLRVFVASGHFDLATPYMATDWTMGHLGLDESLRGNVSTAYFEAGHMMYVHLGELGRLKGELAGFVGPSR